MSATSFVLSMVLGLMPSDGPATLVSRLGAPRYQDREAASTALEQLGRQALPALKAAQADRDTEIRGRAAALIGRIESSLLTRPSLVSLDFEDVPLRDVLKSVGEQAGVRFRLVPENAPQWDGRRVTLRADEPLPFWSALDRLCEASRVQANASALPQAVGGEPVLALFEGNARPSNPVSDSGLFRVTVVGLHLQRDVAFPMAEAGAKAPEPLVNQQFYAQLQVAVEPRLTLSQNGPTRVDEAVDDRGRSLASPSQGRNGVRVSGYFGYAAGSVVQLQVPLDDPGRSGSVLRKLKGAVPVVVSMRKPDPVVVPLNNDAVGRGFQNDDVAITLQDVRKVPNSQQWAVELTVRPASGGDASAPVGADPSHPRPNGHHQQIELSDGRGRTLPWYQSSFDAGSGRMTLNVTDPEARGASLELRYYDLVRAATEVPFAFSDVPLP